MDLAILNPSIQHRGIIVYIHRVPECLSLRRNRISLHPSSPGKRVRLPPWTQKGGGGGEYSLSGDGVVKPNRTTGRKAWHSVQYTLWYTVLRTRASIVASYIILMYASKNDPVLEDPFRKMAVKGIFR